MTRRALVVCPGRGSYSRDTLGSLSGRSPAVDVLLDACDAHREAHGRPGVRALDAEATFRTTRHVAGEHASLLTFACTLADAFELDRERYEVVGVTGNSMGWYTALAASGALSLADAVRLVDTMGAYQQGTPIGGQVLLPCSSEVRAGHLENPSKVAAIDAVLAACRDAGHAAEWSIRLGGYAVLGADKAGIRWLLEHLPKETRGSRAFPVQLPMHSAFHTALLRDTSETARNDLADLQYQAPDVPLVDGRGMVFRPFHADPLDLAEYTLGHQVVAPYDFSAAVHTALRHTGADVVVALGPGNSLGGPLARILVAAGWHGVRDSAGLAALQSSDTPALLSFGVPEQRAQLVAG